MFTETEKNLLRKIGVDEKIIEDPSSYDLSDFEDTVGDYLVLKCLDENYEPNEEGLICEDILSKLS